MDMDLAGLSRTMNAAELGQRLRRARVLAGITQAQVAGSDVTAAYVSRIEDGQRRPEFTLLCRMAERLGTTLGEVLGTASTEEETELAVALDHAELALASGDASAALERVDGVLEQVAGTATASGLERRAHFVRAACLEALGELNEAVVLLEDLTSLPAADSSWLQGLIALSRCYRETGDLGQAIAVGERASAIIERLGIGGLTEAIQLSVTVAGAHMLRGDLNLAMRLCMRAVETAEQNHSPMARASAYWNASLIESRNGAHGAALALARKAMAAFELGEDARNLARLRTQVAKMQLRLDPPDALGAIDTLDRAARELDWSSSSTVDRASEHLTRARAHFLLGDFDQARAALAECTGSLPADARVSRASASALEGQIDAATGQLDAAREHFRTAVQILTGIGADREAAQLWFELGGMLAEVGEAEAATDAFRRAAASMGLSASPTPLRAPLRSR